MVLCDFASALAFFWLADLRNRLFVRGIVRDELDAHAPACIRSDQAAKIPPGQFLIVNVNARLAVATCSYVARE